VYTPTAPPVVNYESKTIINPSITINLKLTVYSLIFVENFLGSPPRFSRLFDFLEAGSVAQPLLRFSLTSVSCWVLTMVNFSKASHFSCIVRIWVCGKL
jgi:hypothetical protein